MANFYVKTFDVEMFDRILENGLSLELGKQGKQVSIEAAICEVLNLPYRDYPPYIDSAVRSFKTRLNDSNWSSPQARVAGLRDLGLAQLGSEGVIDSRKFVSMLSEKIIKAVISNLFRQVFPTDRECLKAALRCEIEGSSDAAYTAYVAAGKAVATVIAAYTAYATTATTATATTATATTATATTATTADAAYTAYTATTAAGAAAIAAKAAVAAEAAYGAAAAAIAAKAAAVTTAAIAAANVAHAANDVSVANADEYLILAAQLALECLIELKSPGVVLLKDAKNNSSRRTQ